MGKRTALHEAAERGDSEKLQHLLDEGTYDVNEEDLISHVCLQREKREKRERRERIRVFFQ